MRSSSTSSLLLHTVASLTWQLLELPMTPLKRRLAKQMLPYCVYRNEEGRDGGDSMLLLNREYKPLGWPTHLRARLDYEALDYDGARMFVESTEHDLAIRASLLDYDPFHYFWRAPLPAPWDSYEAAILYRQRVCNVLDINDVSADGAIL